MNKHFLKFRLLGIWLFLAMIAIFSVIAMLLWNALMPGIFGLPALNYLQTAGMVILARILFGGMPGRPVPHGGHNRGDLMSHQGNALRERWMNMSEEERKEYMRSRRGCSHSREFFNEHEKPGGKDAPGEKGDGNE